METVALAPRIFEDVPSLTAIAGVCFWPPANPRRITKEMEDLAERLYTSKGVRYYDSLVQMMEDIENA